MPIRQEPEVPDTHESLREEMEQKPAKELVRLESHELFLITLGTIPPAESDLSILERNEAAVGNSYSMGIVAEVPQDILRTAEGPLAVNDPVVTKKLPDEAVQHLRVREMLAFAVKADLLPGESILKSFLEFPTKDDPEYFFAAGNSDSGDSNESNAGGRKTIRLRERRNARADGESTSATRYGAH